MSFRELLIDIGKPADKDDKEGTGAKLKLLSSYLEQHPLRPLDVATLLMIAAGLAMRQRDPLKLILIASLVKACYGAHPQAREIDETLDNLMTKT
jgi:hypothetical protein